VLLSLFSRHWIAFAAWTAPCSAAPSGQAPKPLRRAEGAGLTAKCAVRAIIICRRNVQSHSALFEDCGLLLGDLSFHRHEVVLQPEDRHD